MKKIFLSLIIISFTVICAVAAEDDKYTALFIRRFLQCIPYAQQQTFEDDSASISRRILGWKDQKCRYVETVTQNNESKTYNCNFTREQMNELISVMRSDPKGESTAETSWNKFKKLENVCTQQ